MKWHESVQLPSKGQLSELDHDPEGTGKRIVHKIAKEQYSEKIRDLKEPVIFDSLSWGEDRQATTLQRSDYQQRIQQMVQRKKRNRKKRNC